MRSTRPLSTLALLFLASACASGAASTTTSAPTAVTGGLSVEELRRDMAVFASDSFGGRETGTPYADKAARWLAMRMQQIGLEPGGDSGYFARVPMVRSAVTAGAIEVSGPGGTKVLKQGKDLAFLTTLGPGAPLPKNSVDAEIVFAGYGLVDPAIKRDDYAGLSVAGKVVVIAGTVPPGLDAAKTKELENPQSLFNRLGAAIGRQAAAVVLLLPDSVYLLASDQFSSNQISLDKGEAAPANTGPRPLPMVAVGRMGSSLMPPGWPASTAPLAAGTRLKASYNETATKFNGYNMVGIARGSDPALSKTYVAYGAHYDHIGIGEPVNGDSINNGADDDGSGSVTLLAIAQQWMKGTRPKRSALFVWHIGEEKGLFGSEAFTDKPTVPLDSVVAQLNADMIGRNGNDSLYIVGPGAAPNGQSAVLGAVIDSVNAANEKFTFNREWDTTTHPERIYYRSDHFNYARKGIPIVFFTSGLHDQYHKPTDEAKLINYEKMAKVGDLMYRAGIALGNRPTRPKPTGVQ